MLSANGHVYSCGTQTEGAMGLGYEATINQTPSIVRLTASHPIVQVACGSRHSLLLSSIGVVWACGDNKRGQLGVGGCKHSATPVIVEVLSGVRLLTCGEAHSIASTFDPATLEERVYAWDANSSGQLGIGGVHDQFIPEEVEEIQMFRNRPESKVVSFGSNALGQLGVGRNSEGRDVTRCSPSVVPPLSHKDERNIVMCSAAAMHSIFLDASGETFVCGDNTELHDRSTRLDPLDGEPAIWTPALLHQIKVYHVRYFSTSETHTSCLATTRTASLSTKRLGTDPSASPSLPSLKPKRNSCESGLSSGNIASPVSVEDEYIEFKKEYLARKVIVVVESELVLIDYIDWEARFFIRWLDDERQLAEVSGCAPTKAEMDRWSRQPGNSTRTGGGREVVPYKAVYFVHLEEAQARGLQPYPQQAEWYGRLEVLDSSLEEAYEQPRAERPFPRDPFPENCIFVNGTAYSMGLLKASAFRVGDTHAISIRKSRIPFGGRGVFAEKPFFRHELVSLYWGHMFSEAQRAFMKNQGGGELSTHCIPLMQKLSYLDGMHSCLMKGMYVGQMLNMGGRGSNFNNCEFHIVDVTTNGGRLGRSKGVPTAMKAVVVRATRYIFPGEELYVSYGASFWNKQDIVCLEPPPVHWPLALEQIVPSEDYSGESARPPSPGSSGEA
ncbi:HT and RLD domain containing E3 ubiquitin protein ligase [Perkinsus olseni]|uniref:HT and RLD domain containing E3 ubiquitin protein ligase n=1 Tax=Perkinsus olseni TaxID=32597 RepID=A0A7J6QCG5_PEROL|nr:HT and RLD domain containing E3 ubiquitin protein ligase [Perkinsus olseni]